MSSQKLGEERHARCKFGALSPAWIINAKGVEEPVLMPLCLWTVPRPHPPGLDRAWGGAVEYHRDCAVCPAYKPL